MINENLNIKKIQETCGLNFEKQLISYYNFLLQKQPYYLSEYKITDFISLVDNENIKDISITSDVLMLKPRNIENSTEEDTEKNILVISHLKTKIDDNNKRKYIDISNKVLQNLRNHFEPDITIMHLFIRPYFSTPEEIKVTSNHMIYLSNEAFFEYENEVIDIIKKLTTKNLPSISNQELVTLISALTRVKYLHSINIYHYYLTSKIIPEYSYLLQFIRSIYTYSLLKYNLEE